jgi:hypothetical protein
MSANVMVEIICDGCDASVTEWHTTPARLRSYLADHEGWSRAKGDDFCISCRRDARPKTPVLTSVRQTEAER